MSQYLYWKFSNILPHFLIDSFVEEHKHKDATLGLVDTENFDPSVRRVMKNDVDDFHYMSLLLLSLGIKANDQYWKYDLENTHQCEYLQYHATQYGYYQSHIDSLMLSKLQERKLTVIGLLNNDYQGGRFYLQVDGDKKQFIPTQKSDVIVFPSFYLHGVEKVQSGIRKSIVTWLYGPCFR